MRKKDRRTKSKESLIQRVWNNGPKCPICGDDLDRTCQVIESEQYYCMECGNILSSREYDILTGIALSYWSVDPSTDIAINE